MVDISVIIVNYNVKYFLRQCIQSVYDASEDLKVEIFVVDNDSVDGSVEMVESEFPEVISISNKENVGFSKANNQAIKKANGKYILILNPDTLVRKDTLKKCFDFAIDKAELGALGVKLLDGNSNYLPESKRGFPTPWISFCKFSGLGKLFSKTKLFNEYYMGHLPADQTSKVDVLTGAFMFIPKTVLDTVGHFDERFFMYGEDIDLSYRIKLNGNDVYYFPDTSIIHYKGESTKKSSINYVGHFYNAMILFTEKHFNQKRSGLLGALKLAIYSTAFIGVVKNVFELQLKIVFDIFLIVLSLFGISKIYGLLQFGAADYYQVFPLLYHLIAFTSVWVLMAYIFGHYDSRSSYRKFLVGLSFGSLSALLIYSLFPEEWRFSRAIILMGVPISALVLFFTKKLRNKILHGNGSFIPESAKTVFIVGTEESASHVKNVLLNNLNRINILGFINPESDHRTQGFLADLSELEDAVKVYDPNEIIFCSKDVRTDKIFNWMTKLGPNIRYKIASKDNNSILGSDSKNRMGSWYTLDVFYKITDVTLLRLKRIFDLFGVLLLTILSPIFIIFGKLNLSIFPKLLQVLIGKLSFVGFIQEDENLAKLPTLKKGVFDTRRLSNAKSENVDVHQLNLYYAKNYAVWQDLELIWKNLI